MKQLRALLARLDSLPRLAVLGLLTGILSAVVIILFRELTELSQTHILGLSDPDNYEQLDSLSRLLLATGGGLLLGIAFHFLTLDARPTGVVHVIERLQFHQGRLPLKNALTQFLGAITSIVSGHSVGREGPGIHLGAASGSQLGIFLGLSSNDIRTLVACGAAASIAAGFDTPLAGVIFVMEVIMMEYTIHRFAPIILASVSATILTRIYYDSTTMITVDVSSANMIGEMAIFTLMGLAIGILAAVFIQLLLFVARLTANWVIWLRYSLAGLLCGLLAIPTPEIMGVGYDTITSILNSDPEALLLLSIIILKLIATACAIGLGLPGGLIGPTLVIGAAAGGLTGVVVETLMGSDMSDIGFYAIIGMVTMMGATLQAPLAALMALLELTANPGIILPGMLAVITANLICSELFKQESVFVMLMRYRGLDPMRDPFVKALQNKPVTAVLEHRIRFSEPVISYLEARALIEFQPKLIVVKSKQGQYSMFPLVDLVTWMKEHDSADQEDAINLLELPAERFDLGKIPDHASVYDALETMNKENVDALLVTERAWQGGSSSGVVTREAVRNSYRFDNPNT
ncbi:MAG: chloride channel protein [Pseudomonadota bacterium]|nr:chloride channel protein [Pseudomonadota bacterium]